MAKKSMAPKRKGKRQYPLVTFEMEGFDGEFTLPKIDTLPMKVQRALPKNDMDPLMEILEEVSPGMEEAFDDLAGDEVETFFSHWTKASGVEQGK